MKRAKKRAREETKSFYYIMGYIFLKSVLIGKKMRVRALDHQKINEKSAEVYDSTLNVKCPSRYKTDYPEGSLFYCYRLNLCSRSGSAKFYDAGSSVYPFDPTKTKGDSVAAYQKYMDGIVAKAEKEKAEETIKEAEAERKERSIMADLSSDPKLAAPTSTKDGFFINKEDWLLLLRNIKKHVNTMIIGQTGTGKTSVVKLACEHLGIKLHVFDMGSVIDPISSLLGVHRLEDGKSVFDYANFTKAIQEPCVILLDELSRASLASNNILFPCLDDRRKLSIEIAGSKGVREIAVHPDVTFVATANVGAEYTGTQSLDRALTNRFFPIELTYIPNTEEQKVLVKRTGITSEEAKLIVKVAQNIRSLAEKQEISTSVSIRETLLVADLVNDGWTVGNAIEKIFAPLYEGTKSTGERSIVYKTIASY